jgi:hypothetical protein
MAKAGWSSAGVGGRPDCVQAGFLRELRGSPDEVCGQQMLILPQSSKTLNRKAQGKSTRTQRKEIATTRFVPFDRAQNRLSQNSPGC